jgi:uncharacterized repeat protein (TIGR02543 family)
MKKHISILMLVFISLYAVSCEELILGGDTVKINLTVSPPEAGSIVSTGGNRVGNTVELVAVANMGWLFDGWTGDFTSDENTLIIVLEENLNLTANFLAMSNEYRFAMSITDNQTTVNMAFGQIPGATDAFDSGIDLEAPPAPPDGTLHAWFENENRQLLRDFRNVLTSEITWPLSIEPGIADSVWINWTLDEESLAGGVFLTNTARTFDVSMTEVSSFSIHIDELDNLEIIFSYQF